MKTSHSHRNGTGVTVSLDALDPNGNFVTHRHRHIRSNWPVQLRLDATVPDLYTIVASFAGSGAYYGSTAETSVYVNSAPAAAATPPPAAPVTNYTNAILYAVIAIIIAMIVAVAVAILILRKRA